MSFVKSINTVYNEMQRQDIKLWQVFDQNKVDIIAESSDDLTALTVHESIEHLTEVVNNLEGMIYIVIRKDGAAPKRKALSGSQSAGMNDQYKGIYKFQVLVGDAANNQNKAGGNMFSGGNMGMFNMILESTKANFDIQLKHLQEKTELEKAFEERMRKLEDKLQKRDGDGGGMISDEYAKKGLDLLERLLDKKK